MQTFCTNFKQSTGICQGPDLWVKASVGDDCYNYIFKSLYKHKARMQVSPAKTIPVLTLLTDAKLKRRAVSECLSYGWETTMSTMLVKKTKALQIV